MDRSAALRELHQHFPALARWAEWCYSKHSNLLFGTHTIDSQTGVQQGDPLGPLLFSLAIHPLANTLAGQGKEGRPGHPLDLVLFYLDDGVLCGSPEAVSEALATLSQQAGLVGLHLNVNKCELVAMANTAPTGLSNLFPPALLKDMVESSPTYGQSRVLLDGEFEILGAPVGSAPFCASHTSARIQKALPVLDAIATLEDTQVALRLQRHCHGYSKLGYSTRVVPSANHATELQAFDAAQRAAFNGYMAWSPNDQQWSQATRGFRHAGLGLRSSSAHAAPAYIASRLATSRFCRELDPAHTWEGADANSALGKSALAYNAAVGQPDQLDLSSEPEAAVRQQTLSKAVDQLAHTQFFQSLNDSDRKHVLSETLQGASGFLEAKPSKEQGLAWDPKEFSTEVRFRLMDNLFPEDSWCPACDGVLDRKGRHAGTCPSWGDKTRRHNAARNRTSAFATAAGQNPTLEQPGLLQPSPGQPNAGQRRPADVYLPSWNGSPAALDFAITSPHRLDAPREATSTAGAAAAAYEAHKRAYLNTAEDCVAQGIAFIPMVGEPSSGWGTSAICTFKALAKAQTAGTDLDSGSVLASELQHLSTAVRRANARAVLCRSCHTTTRP